VTVTVPQLEAAWVALRLDVPAEAAEAVVNFLFEAGASGIVLEDGDGAEATASGRALIEAPLPVAASERVASALVRYLAALAGINPAVADVRVETVPVPTVDWIALARRHHRPVLVGHRLAVAPPWELPAVPGREVLVIEPGMAFGTGQHPTTRGCLQAIEAALDRGGIASALDVGTGSGVLAAALARLGVPRVVALDHDTAVLPLARATFRRNRAPAVLTLAGTAAALRATFDLVVANLLADVLVTDAPLLGARVAPGGRLIVSGILDAQVAEIQRAYGGWWPAETRAEGGWHTITLARRPGAGR
jgi:ribosomal protein L11 methyltransferase